MATSYELFLDGRDRTGPAINSAKRNFEQFGGSVTKFGTALAGVLGAAGVGALLKNVVDTADRVSKLSDRLGASTEFLSRFNFALEQSGVNLQTGATALQRLTRNASDAANKGVGVAAEAFRELGINAAAFTQLPLREQVLTLAEALNRVDDSGRRVALTQKLMDSEGVALLQTFEGGADAVQGFLDRADELGRTIGPEAAKNAAIIKDRMNELKSSFVGATNSLLEFLPRVIQFSKWIEEEVVPNILSFARAIGILGNSMDDLTLAEINEQINDLNENLFMLGKMINSPNLGEGFERRYRKEFAENLKELNELEERRAEILGNQQERLAFAMPEGVSIDPLTPTEEQREKTKEIREEQLEEDKSFLQRKYEIYADLVARGNKQITKIEVAETRKRRQFAIYEATQQQRGFFQILTQTTQGVAQHNRVLFEINRVGAIANATIAALEGPAITEGSYPWPFGHILAGIHYASQIARIAAIVSTSYSGSGSGSAPSLATGGAPVTPVTATGETMDMETAETTTTAEATPAIQVTLVAEDVESTRRQIDRINEVHKDGYRLQVS